jgi:hypothetical protein
MRLQEMRQSAKFTGETTESLDWLAGVLWRNCYIMLAIANVNACGIGMHRDEFQVLFRHLLLLACMPPTRFAL